MTSDLTTQTLTPISAPSSARVRSNPVAQSNVNNTQAPEVNLSSTTAPVTNTQQSSAIEDKAQAQQNNSAQTNSKAEIKAAISEIKSQLKSVDREINFAIDEELDMVIIKVLDKDTEEVIRQIPSVEMVAIARRIEENKGLLLQEEV